MVSAATRLAALLGALPAMAALAAAPAGAASVLRSAGGGAVRALVVGINDYSSVRPKLEGSVPDAADIAEALRRDGVTALRVLTDRDATRQAFLDAMGDLLDASRPGDLAVVTYSGHGGTVPEYPQFKGLEPGGRTEEFVMADYAASGPATAEIVANKEIKAFLARFDAKGVDVLLVADSCFGGGMVRGLPDPRAGRPVLRVARDVEPVDGSSFTPMAMTAAELRADVSALAHVTVLSGADRFTPVPEVAIPAQPTKRGALSFAMARALDGKAGAGQAGPGQAGSGDGATTRRQLFAYARQEVQHYSDNQRIDNTPRAGAGDPAVLDRPVFRLSEAAAPTAEAAPPAPAAPSTCPVKLAVINGAGAASIADAGVPVELVSDPGWSDLVWDVRAEQVVQSAGDVIAGGIGPAAIAGVLQRTSAVQCIKALTVDRPQGFTLRDGVRRYTPRDRPVLEAADVSGRFLLVFNVAADGRLQVVWPPRPGEPAQVRATWMASPNVTEPFGADYAVAVTTAAEQAEFLQWLDARDNRGTVVADELLGWLRRIRAADPTTRIGAVSLYTGAN